MLRSVILSVILLSLATLTSSLHASDLEKEKRWETQIVDALISGEAVKLKAGTTEFLGIFTPHNTEKASGAAIVIHGIGAHPDWTDVVNPLRSQLPDYGWMTLSLQMPILPNEATLKDYAPLFDEVAPRIDAAVAYLKQKGVQNIVIVAHSLGSRMSAYYLSQKPDPSIRAFVAIGMSSNGDDPRMKTLDALQKIKLPVLDLYGSADLPEVLSSVKNRKDAATRAGNKHYLQVEVSGADHFFGGHSDELIKRVRGWLAQNAAGMELPAK